MVKTILPLVRCAKSPSNIELIRAQIQFKVQQADMAQLLRLFVMQNERQRLIKSNRNSTGQQRFTKNLSKLPKISSKLSNLTNLKF